MLANKEFKGAKKIFNLPADPFGRAICPSTYLGINTQVLMLVSDLQHCQENFVEGFLFLQKLRKEGSWAFCTCEVQDKKKLLMALMAPGPPAVI